jgi:DNA (cytosine-5)-methyltransferase 1
MTSVEIFSGAGGLAKGLEIAGFKHMAFVEWNKDACASLRANFHQERVYCGDIQTYDFSQVYHVDVVAGGPPCQPFSLGGKHQGNLDQRDLFPSAIKTIQALTPKLFIFENVKGLLRDSFAEYFSYILLRLRKPCFTADLKTDWKTQLSQLRKNISYQTDESEYCVSYRLLNAADYGVPQCRERVFIVGIDSKIGRNWEFPAQTHSEDRLLYDQYVTGEYWDRHSVPKSQRPQISASILEKIQKIKHDYLLFAPEGKPWQTIRDCLGNVPDPKSQHGIPDHIFRDGARSYPGHTGSCYDYPAKTIKAGGHGVPGGENMIRYQNESVRYLTVYEAKKIQTFPDDYIIAGAWGEALRQIGNAVPVLLAEKMGAAAMAFLKVQANAKTLIKHAA